MLVLGGTESLGTVLLEEPEQRQRFPRKEQPQGEEVGCGRTPPGLRRWDLHLPSCWDPHTRKEELNTALKITSFFLIEKEKLKKYRKI